MWLAHTTLQLICCLVANNVLPYQLNLISGQWSKICLYESLRANIWLIYYLFVPKQQQKNYAAFFSMIYNRVTSFVTAIKSQLSDCMYGATNTMELGTWLS
jgi:hypothetical protein